MPIDEVYDVRSCLMRRCLTIRVSGLWDAPTMTGYRRVLREKTLEMVERDGYRGALLDASEYPIQSGAVAASHAEAMTIARKAFSVRAAVYMEGVRSRLQMSRLTEHTGHRLFGCRAEALDWLLS